MARPQSSYLTRRRWSVADARSALSALTASGLSMPEFAAREGLDVERLRRWRRRLAGAHGDAGPKFVEIRARAPEPIEIVLRSGRVLRVAESVDPSAVLALVDALERAQP